MWRSVSTYLGAQRFEPRSVGGNYTLVGSCATDVLSNLVTGCPDTNDYDSVSVACFAARVSWGVVPALGRSHR